MKIPNAIVIVFVGAVLLSGCTGTTINSDYDHDVDFSKYKTFAWYDHSESKYKPQQPNQIVDTRIHRAVATELLGKGLQQTSPDKADVLITYHTSSEQMVDVYHSGYGYGYGYWGGYWGPYGRMPTTTVSRYDVGTLIIDVIDRRKNDLVWRGMVQKALSERDSSEVRINDYVKRVLKTFPPGS